jgi:hypothetical protein
MRPAALAPLSRALSAAAVPPPGLSPRIAALIRRGGGDDVGSAAAAAAGDAAASSSLLSGSPPPRVAPAAARAALVERNASALAQLRGMLTGDAGAGAALDVHAGCGGGGGAGAASAPPRRSGGAAAAAAAVDEEDAAMLRDVHEITQRARRGSQARWHARVRLCAFALRRHALTAPSKTKRAHHRRARWRRTWRSPWRATASAPPATGTLHLQTRRTSALCATRAHIACH